MQRSAGNHCCDPATEARLTIRFAADATDPKEIRLPPGFGLDGSLDVAVKTLLIVILRSLWFESDGMLLEGNLLADRSGS